MNVVKVPAKGHDFVDGVCSICDKNQNGNTPSEPDEPNVDPEEPEYNCTFSILKPSTTTINHQDGIKLHANIEGDRPKGSYVRWTASNGKFKTTEINGGDSLEIISDSNGKTVFTATLYSEDGKVLATDSVEMTSKAGFFDKISSFFRLLFGDPVIREK